MGACYSRKAGGGKYTYSTVQMASTKLEDTSRLARPTPYCRNTSGPVPRKGIPVSTKCEPHHVNSNQQNDLKAIKSPSPIPPQSSIPRFNSNVTPGTTKGEINENIVSAISMKNENNELHLVNNNLVSGTSPATRISEANSKPNSGKKVTDTKGCKINTNSKGCPEYISVQVKINEKSPHSRIPAKFTYATTTGRSFLPQFVSKGSPATSVTNSECKAEIKLQPNETSIVSPIETKPSNQNVLLTDGMPEAVLNKSKTNSESHDSIADSGLGSSLTEKSKQDDGDTLKDVERLECYEDTDSPENKLSKELSESSSLEEKATLKCPTYKRGLNGKWTLEDKNLIGLQKSAPLIPEANTQEKQCQPLKSPHKGNIVGSSSFPTYASYKGMMSYKKYSAKSQSQPVSKVGTPEKKGNTADGISIPKMANGLHNLKHESNKDILKIPEDDEDGRQNYPPSSTTSPCSSTKQSSLESDDKSDGLGSETKSPPSEIENREFLIDDEIADQPSLISFVNGRDTDSPVLSLQQSVTELHALQSLSCSVRKNSEGQAGKFRRDRLGSDHRDSLLLSFEIGSSCSSIASDDLMLDYEKKDFPEGPVNEGLASPLKKVQDLDQGEEQAAESEKFITSDAEVKTRKRLYRRSSGPFIGSSGLAKDEWRLRSVSLPLRPPRPMSVSEADDGSIVLDSSSYRLLSQDLNGVKTLLLRLKSVIQEAETINPFDHPNTKNIFYHSLVNNDVPCNMTLLSEEKQGNKLTPASLTIENADLRRQLVLLQQQLEEKNRTIHLLQQQMTKYTNTSFMQYDNVHSANAATQTERTRSLTGSLTSSLENSCETLVSFRISKCTGHF